MPVNDATANRSYQKPNAANQLSYDVGRLRSALDAIDTDVNTALSTLASGSQVASPAFSYFCGSF